jgi:mRNA interferase MazF
MPSAMPGDVVTVDFAGATGVKRRPVVVVSSDAYHAERPDVILGVLTSNVGATQGVTSCLIQDWKAAGLHSPSAFRAYFGMAVPDAIRKIGRLSQRDWQAVRDCVRAAFG